ncbi:hypothetical protein BHE74_00036010 [Ensete ventricosum]|nr:hypothetical protein BHE74_00036010 [Ensete ventricosum]RZS12787.1 hypothetical protein BHM03_00044287 [Ensete ventricosum]
MSRRSWRWSFITSCWGSTKESSVTETKKPRPSRESPQRLSYYDISNSGTPLSPEDLSLSLPGSNLHVFTLAELKAVTRNFSTTNFIGSGGFGPVFKGYVDDKLRPGLKAQHVAVKSLDLEGLQGHREWLVSVLAALFVGAAKGLAFLHEAEKPVIYRDFKASNILLDSLSDFGLAKDGPQGEETHVTTRVMGTRGYAAPEYVLTGKTPKEANLLSTPFHLREQGAHTLDRPCPGHLTAKSDVYSFGVVLLELLTGRRSVDKNRSNREKNLVEWARPQLNDPHKLSRVMDRYLEGQYSTKGTQKAAAVAYKCLNLNPKKRPDMRAVVEILEPLLELNDVPIGPFVYTVPAETETDGRKEMDMKTAAKVNGLKQRFPNTAVRSEATIHRDSKGLYKNSPSHHHQSSRRQNREHGV